MLVKLKASDGCRKKALRQHIDHSNAGRFCGAAKTWKHPLRITLSAQAYSFEITDTDWRRSPVEGLPVYS